MVTDKDIEIAKKIKIELDVFLKTRNCDYRDIGEVINFLILKIAKLEKSIITNYNVNKD